MRVTGHRKLRPVTANASGDLLKEGALFNDEIIDLDGIPIRTLSLERLLKTKQSGRDKDKMDRLVLEKALTALRS